MPNVFPVRGMSEEEMYVAFRTPAEIALQKRAVVISGFPRISDRLEYFLSFAADVAQVVEMVQ